MGSKHAELGRHGAPTTCRAFTSHERVPDMHIATELLDPRDARKKDKHVLSEIVHPHMLSGSWYVAGSRYCFGPCLRLKEPHVNLPWQSPFGYSQKSSKWLGHARVVV